MLWSTIVISAVFSTILISGIEEDHILNHMGTRTPYRLISNKNDVQITYPNCKDAKIWMLLRHGTRLPSPKDVIGMNTTLKRLKGEILESHRMGRGDLTKEQIENLSVWSSSIPLDQSKDLALEGEEEMVLVAERMQSRFPNAVPKQYDNVTYQFRYTATQRAQQSAKFFTRGLFDMKSAQNVQYVPAKKIDPVLRFYKHCDKWQRQVKKNESTHVEQNLFGLSREMNVSLEQISKRLGLARVLTLAEANLMYKICGFETAWRKDFLSPWCYAFDVDSAQKLEYYQDLQHYWVDGYGHELTHKLACLSVNTMLDSFDNPDPPTATFHFAHSGTLLKVLAHLQLYRPLSPLRGASIDHERVWRATEIDCFAANLAFVLFKCDDGDHVLTLHQEKVIQLPMCLHQLCPITTLRSYFRESIRHCDYNEMCDVDNDDDPAVSVVSDDSESDG